MRCPLTPLCLPFRETIAWSSRAARISLPKPGTNRRWMRSAVSLPPLPWPSKMRSYCDLGNGQAPNSSTAIAVTTSAMSDYILFAPDNVNQIPQDMEQRLVTFLDAVDAEARHGETVVAELGHASAVAAGEPDGEHADLAGRLQRAIDVCRLAARRDTERHVALPCEHAQLLDKG